MPFLPPNQQHQSTEGTTVLEANFFNHVKAMQKKQLENN